jgi:two-component system chemotaxis response regulator CheY
MVNAARHVRVLVVDDVEVLRTMVKRILERDGRFDIVGEATDGNEAVTQAATLQPDLVMLDLMMPGRDGISALRDIRELSPGSQVVLLTGFAGDKPGDLGPDLCLHKSLEAPDMIAALERLVPALSSEVGGARPRYDSDGAVVAGDPAERQLGQ